MRRKKLVILGLEFWYHAWYLTEALAQSPHVEIVGACSTNDMGRKLYKEDFGIPVYPTAAPLWDLQPDIAFISGRTSHAHEYSIDALEHGCHLIAARPVALTMETAGELRRAASLHPDQLITVQYYTHFWPEIQEMMRIVNSGLIGTPVAGSFVTHRAGPGEEYRGGPPGWWDKAAHNNCGGFGSHNIYCINLARKMFGDAGEAKGLMIREDGAELEHRGIAAVRYGDAIVGYDGCWKAAPGLGGWAFQVVGTEGEVSVDYRREPAIYVITDGKKRYPDFPPLDKLGAWREMVHAFASAIDGDRKVAVTLDEGIDDVRVLAEIYRQSDFVEVPSVSRV